MLLENKKILIMGIRNKWSIAYGIAKSAYENGAKLIFTYIDEESRPKLEALVEEFKGSKFYKLEDASEDEKVVTEALSELQKNYEKPIVVENEPLKNFYSGEEYHQDYLDKNPSGYCHINPELFELAKKANLR